MTEPAYPEIEAGARRLEEAAARLRGGELTADEAAALVERCAELAAELAAELDRRAREAQLETDSDSSIPGQEELL